VRTSYERWRPSLPTAADDAEMIVGSLRGIVMIPRFYFRAVDGASGIHKEIISFA
jgi:hypothetical protein